MIFWLKRTLLGQEAVAPTLAGARERAAQGAAYLDDADPGWYRHVEADSLALSDGQSCILGQLHGDFRLGLIRAHLLNLSSAPRANLSPVRLGFFAVRGADPAVEALDYDYLDQAWREEVLRRQAEDAASFEEEPIAAYGVV